MSISAQMVKDLRRLSGAGIMECKEALKQSDGDSETALEFLRKKGTAKAAKKADRSTKEGAIGMFVSDSTCALVELKCETDFVARNENFQSLCKTLAKVAATADTIDDDEGFMGAAVEDGSSKTVNDIITEKIHELGENIVPGRRAKLDMDGPGAFACYIHGAGSIGVIVTVACGSAEVVQDEKFAELRKDIAMHIAATNPVAIDRADVPEDVVNKEKAILEAQAAESGKPEKIIPKIVEGRLNKFFSESCLLEQAFVKDPDVNVKTLLEQTGKQLGSSFCIKDFVRFELGE